MCESHAALFDPTSFVSEIHAAASASGADAATCSVCKDRGYVWLGSQPYGIFGESYAPCSCHAGEAWIAEHKAMQARMLAKYEGERNREEGQQ